MIPASRIVAAMVRSGAPLVVVSTLLACGAAPPPTDATNPPAATAGANSGGADTRVELPADVLLPMVGFVAPDAPIAGASLELATEDEELSFELAAPEGDIDEIIDGMREVFQAMVGNAGATHAFTLGDHQGKMLSIVGDERGQRVALGFALVEVEDGRQARLSYQVRGRADPGAVLERVLASFSRTRPETPADGFRVVGIAGYFMEAPVRMLVANATLMLEGGAEIQARVVPSRGADDDDDPLLASTTTTVGSARRVSNIVRDEVTLAGGAAARARYRVTLGQDADEEFQEEAAEIELAEHLVLFVRGSRLSPRVDFAELLASFRRTDRP